MPSICVFCGSSVGNDPVFSHAAKELGRLIAKYDCTLIYGGGKVGLMGILADEVLRNSGKVTGIIPHFLYQREVGHDGLTQLEIVQSMHERKKRMADLTDYFIAMPGGWGTLDELAEILTWRQLNLVSSPVGLLNTKSFFDPLLNQLDQMTANGFVHVANSKTLIVGKEPFELLTMLGVVAV
ncbi:MAG TPA: TIGR00730 family Rossman fold protein [Cyclobacteriaceae bacterium]|nr:TIGR00730 family Rossman fold protein [Cyclobacteriaceae bacterium]